MKAGWSDYLAWRRYAGKHDLLTAEEERDLRRRGDIAGLVLSNLRLVLSLSRIYSRTPGIDVMDVVQAGHVGLVEAAQRFDPERGTRFVNIAHPYIKKEMRVCAAKHRSMLSGQSNIAMADLVSVGALEVPGLDGDYAAMPLADEGASAEDLLADDQFRRHVNAWVLSLARNANERAVIQQRLLAEDPSTLEEIGQRVNRTRERIRQIEAQLFGRIRSELEAA